MRYLVVGTSGSGKSTFAQALAAAVGCPHVELDAHYWGPGWQPVPTARFAQAVDEATRGERWVVDGNYSAVRELLWSRATHVVWLNYGRATVFARVFRRTLHRALSRAPLWHGNRESLRKSFLSKDSILLWSLTTFDKNRDRYAALRAGGSFARLQWVEITAPSQAPGWIDRLAAAARPPG